MNWHITKFIFFNVLLIIFVVGVAYSYRLHTLRRRGEQPVSLIYWMNQGEITMKGVLTSMVFGLVFGFVDNFFLWMGYDKLLKFVPGGGLTRAAWANTYSDFIGAVVGAGVASLVFDSFGVQSALISPVWADALSIPLGAVLGMHVGKLVTGRV